MIATLAALSLAASPSVSVAGSFLAGRAGCGAAMLAGARLTVEDRVAFTLDAGHGGAGREDRYWLIPSGALIVPAGPVQLDLGAGVGLGVLGASTALTDAPRDPARSLFPAVRAHVRASLPVGKGFSLFGRADAGALLWLADDAGLAASPSGNLWLGLELDLS